MSRYGGNGYHRTKPKISFMLATCCLFLMALVLTGIFQIQVNLDVINTNPRAVVIAVVFVGLAALLLYEW
jgi:uncharacterized membrane protein